MLLAWLLEADARVAPAGQDHDGRTFVVRGCLPEKRALFAPEYPDLMRDARSGYRDWAQGAGQPMSFL